jgi:hypothetical protein
MAGTALDSVEVCVHIAAIQATNAPPRAVLQATHSLFVLCSDPHVRYRARQTELAALGAMEAVSVQPIQSELIKSNLWAKFQWHEYHSLFFSLLSILNARNHSCSC